MPVNNTRDIVKKYSFKFTKSLGQNFLIDDNVIKDIVDGAEVSKEDTIIEIGPGIGTLTKELLKRAKKVYCIELDSELIPILNEELKEYDNLVLINNDALKVDYNQILNENSNVKVVANLPYYVTTPIITKLLKERYQFLSITIMIQKEVALRMISDPNCKQYGSLSVLIQYYCKGTMIRNVLPNCFMPRPKVESTVIRLDILEEPSVKIMDEKLYFRIVRDSFNMRRKTLWNSLKELKLSSEEMKKCFENANIDPKRRGETLSLEEFGKLSDCIHEFF